MRRAALGKPRRLNAFQRDLVEGHFLSLEPEARRLRFGSSCKDEAIVEYVRALDFDRDAILGWRDANFVLGGVVHLARVTETLVEFSISVLEQYRGNGYGQRMTREAFEEAAKHGFDRAHVQFIAANLPDGRHPGSLSRHRRTGRHRTDRACAAAGQALTAVASAYWAVRAALLRLTGNPWPVAG